MIGAAIAGAMAGTASVSRAEPGDIAVRPFKAAVPDAAITAMKRRIAETRWADAEPVSDESQGVRRQRLQKLMDYWAGAYDWRAVETKLNALPMFQTEIELGLALLGCASPADVSRAHVR